MSARHVSPRVAAVVGALASAAILGGLTVANAGFDNIYTGCLNAGGEIKRVAIGTEPIGTCSPNEQQISWNETGPAGPPGTPGVLGFYRVTESFTCAVDPSCPAESWPAPVAECLAGDLATGGAAYRTGPGIPVQDHPARPSTLTNDPVTGFTVIAQTLQKDNTMYVVAICADLP